MKNTRKETSMIFNGKSSPSSDLLKLGKEPVWDSPQSYNDGIHHLLEAKLHQSEERCQRLEAALRESEARFRHLSDTAPLMVWMSGADKFCNYFNQSWLDFTGRTLEQEMGNGWAEGVHPDDFQRCLETYVTAFDTRQPFKMEYRLRRFDGKYRWILDIGTPRLTLEGEFFGYIGSCFDITERKVAKEEIGRLNQTLEERIRDRTAQLEATNQELESFSYSVSHDLRAPLRHIDGFISLLQKRLEPMKLDPISQHYLTTILQTAKQAGILIDDLLAFSRMGRTEMHWMEIKMSQLVQEVQSEVELEAAGRIIHWQIASLPEIKGDLAMIRQVLRNLLGNAVKYTRLQEQAEITIGHFNREQEDIFFVRDNGVGFNEKYIHKLFGIFQRLHSDPQFEGTGIGLANVQRIIHRHGGKVWAEGTIGGGATFYFSLPKFVLNLKHNSHG